MKISKTITLRKKHLKIIAVILMIILSYFITSSEIVQGWLSTPLGEAKIADVLMIVFLADVLGVFKNSKE